MPNTIHIPTPLRPFTDKLDTVEATGVAQPLEMLESLADPDSTLDLQIGRVATVVDTAKLPKLLPLLGEFYANQIRHADIVVLTFVLRERPAH